MAEIKRYTCIYNYIFVISHPSTQVKNNDEKTLYRDIWMPNERG